MRVHVIGKKKYIYINSSQLYIIYLKLIKYSYLLNLPCHSVRNSAQDAFHHGQVLSVVVRLEQRDSQI